MRLFLVKNPGKGLKDLQPLLEKHGFLKVKEVSSKKVCYSAQIWLYVGLCRVDLTHIVEAQAQAQHNTRGWRQHCVSRTVNAGLTGIICRDFFFWDILIISCLILDPFTPTDSLQADLHNCSRRLVIQRSMRKFDRSKGIKLFSWYWSYLYSDFRSIWSCMLVVTRFTAWYENLGSLMDVEWVI